MTLIVGTRSSYGLRSHCHGVLVLPHLSNNRCSIQSYLETSASIVLCIYICLYKLYLYKLLPVDITQIAILFNFFSEVSDAVFLNKTDYIGVSLRQMQGAFNVKMRFKTRNEEGLLLSTKRREKGLYVAVHNGNIQVIIDNKRGKKPFSHFFLAETDWASFALRGIVENALGRATVP